MTGRFGAPLAAFASCVGDRLRILRRATTSRRNRCDTRNSRNSGNRYDGCNSCNSNPYGSGGSGGWYKQLQYGCNGCNPTATAATAATAAITAAAIGSWYEHMDRITLPVLLRNADALRAAGRPGGSGPRVEVVQLDDGYARRSVTPPVCY